MPRDVLRVSVKMPARVKNIEKALKRLGGVKKIVCIVRKVHKKITKAMAIAKEIQEEADELHEGEVKRSGKFLSQQLQK